MSQEIIQHYLQQDGAGASTEHLQAPYHPGARAFVLDKLRELGRTSKFIPELTMVEVGAGYSPLAIDVAKLYPDNLFRFHISDPRFRQNEYHPGELNWDIEVSSEAIPEVIPELKSFLDGNAGSCLVLANVANYIDGVELKELFRLGVNQLIITNNSHNIDGVRHPRSIQDSNQLQELISASGFTPAFEHHYGVNLRGIYAR